MGIIAISDMMTRAILDGSDVQQAARLQIIITLIAASHALSYIIARHLVLRSYVDSEYRIRGDCIDTRPHVSAAAPLSQSSASRGAQESLS